MVRIEDGQRAHGFVERERHILQRRLPGGAQQRGIGGVSPDASGDREDAHRHEAFASVRAANLQGIAMMDQKATPAMPPMLPKKPQDEMIATMGVAPMGAWP